MRLPIDTERIGTECLAACLAKCVEGSKGCSIAPGQVAITGIEVVLQCPQVDCDVQVSVGSKSAVPRDDIDVPTIMARQAVKACRKGIT